MMRIAKKESPKDKFPKAFKVCLPLNYVLSYSKMPVHYLDKPIRTNGIGDGLLDAIAFRAIIEIEKLS